ncbi:MAG TPA: hypothetical protein VMK65_02395 [Longimicrobiales bacterium]|nr:hypothetical protein [Longimicrobiales bacterium]
MPPPPPAAAGLRGPVPVREALAHLDTEAEAEPAAPADPGRRFELDGQAWLARLAGAGAGGTGRAAPAYIEAVHFCREEEPQHPLREALLPRGRFHGLYDEELGALWRRAVEIVDAGGRR